MTIVVDDNRPVVYADEGEVGIVVWSPEPVILEFDDDDDMHIITINCQGPQGPTGGGAVTYTNPNPSVIEVGGIPVGTTFDAVTFDELITQMLYPELFPSFTNPSTSFTASITGRREIGETIAITFNTSFNPGSISPQYGAASPNRAGPANLADFTGTGLADVVLLPNAQTVTNYVVQSGNQSWTCRIFYDEGAQPVGSNGTDYDSPLPAGSTSQVTRTITGVYPVFATTGSITSLTKQSLVNHNSRVDYNFAGETGDGNKQAIEFPALWDEITSLEQYNTLSGQWDPIDLSTFTESVTAQTIQGNVVLYMRYEHNGATIGSRRLRWSS